MALHGDNQRAPRERINPCVIVAEPSWIAVDNDQEMPRSSQPLLETAEEVGGSALWCMLTPICVADSHLNRRNGNST